MEISRPRILAPLCTVLACLWLAAPVAAQGDVPNDNSGVDQYSESLPSSDGGRARSVGGHAPQGVPLSSRVQRTLPGGARGRLLRRVATDPTLGAPVRSKKQPRIHPAAVVATDRPGAVSAIGGALFGSAAIWPIVAIMAVSGVAAIAGAVARRRST
jgi:hypothetical protein